MRSLFNSLFIRKSSALVFFLLIGIANMVCIWPIGVANGNAMASGSDHMTDRILFVGPGTSHQYQSLNRLGYEAELIMAQESDLQQANLFAYSTIFLSSIPNRSFLVSEMIQRRLLQAVERGAVLVGFRSYGGALSPFQDEWLPVGATKDGAYKVSEILEPDHPIFNYPNTITIDTLRSIHSGVMYHPYVQLGEGWIPLISGDELMPFFRNESGVPPFDGEPHYGIIELPYGEGRIMLVQMIPDYQWLNNDKGSDDSVGRLFIENIIDYAVRSSLVTSQEIPEIPKNYVDGGLGAVLNWVKRPSVPEMSLDVWDTTTEGSFSVKWDDRDVITIHHPDVPAKKGNYATISRKLPVRAGGRGATLLNFYITDDYIGGIDPILEGDGQIGSVQNWKEGYRFIEIAIDGDKIWETDVIGRNPFPWPHSLRTLDVTKWVQGKDEVEISVTVINRDSTDDSFWTQVFVSRIGLMEGVPYSTGVGRVEVFEGGTYVPVVQVTDAPGERSSLSLSHDGEEWLSLSLTADDLREHWAIGYEKELSVGEWIDIEFIPDRSGGGEEHINGVYLLPKAYVDQSDIKVVDVRSWFVADTPADRIELTVKGPEGVKIAAPVSHGIPFSKGSLYAEQLDQLRLFDTMGHSIPLQVKTLAKWPDGSVKWALLSFIGQPDEYVLVTSGNFDRDSVESFSEAELARRPLIESMENNRFLVDTGRLRFVLDVNGSPEMKSATIDGKPIRIEEMDFSLAYENGPSLSLADSEISEVRLLENGSEHSALWVRGNYVTGNSLDLEFTLQWRFYKNQPFMWIDVTFTNRLGRNVRLSDIRFQIKGSFGKTIGILDDDGSRIRRFALPARPDAHFDGWSLIQPDESTFSIYDDGEIEGSGKRFAGWVVLDDVVQTICNNCSDDVPMRSHKRAGYKTSKYSPAFFAGVRHFWEQYPKSVRVTHSSLEFGLWANETKQIIEVADGFQKTHELLFGLIDLDETESIGKLLYQPYVLTFDPEYLVGTGALGILTPPANRDGYPEFLTSYEKSVDLAYTDYMSKRENRREYGMQNFGDDTFEWGYGPSYTFWSNQEYDHHFGFLLEHLRSGDLRFWQIGDQAARHYRDVDIIHHSTNPDRMGAPRAHNTKHIVEYGWYPDHNLGGVAVHHAWVEGLWLHYLITGDQLTYEAARGASDWFVSEVMADRWYRGNVERGPGWALIALVGAYRATSDKKYLDAAKIIVEDTYLRQDPIRGMYIKPVDGRPSFEGGTSFMTSIFARGMSRYYLETGDARAALTVSRFYDWLTREMRVSNTSFLTRPAPGWHSPGNSDQLVSVLAFGLAFNNRKKDWPMVMEAANIRANPRSMSWIPEALAILEYLYGKYVPLEIILSPTERITVDRVGASEGILTLARLDRDHMIEGTLYIEGVPEGMTVSPEQLNYKLETGEGLASFPITVHATPILAPKRYTLTVRGEDPSELSTILPVEIPSRTIVDRFLPPVENSWFSGMVFRMTEEQSEGWEYVQVDRINRLRRAGPSEEYLIYDMPGLFDFSLIFYSPITEMKSAEKKIIVSMTTDGEHWETVPTNVVWDTDTGGHDAKGIITPEERYVRDDVKLKVTVLSGGSADTVQLERIDIIGWRR